MADWVVHLGGPFSTDIVETVRDAGDIVGLVSEYVPLKQSGSRLKGLCPFHEEKTPSFSVDPQRQLFYCFGCQTGGDVFKFVMLYEKLSFPESLDLLANRWGVALPSRQSSGDNRRERLLAMNQEVVRFFQTSLSDRRSGSRCREYLNTRGIGAETVEKLGIGYAPDGWEALFGHLRSKRFKPEEMLEGGLVLARKSGSGHYDRFRERLMFPIRDVQGRTVAFGGRAIGDAEPKYINSPETPLYTKGNQLYGLDQSREPIRRKGMAIIVEGYMDLVALVQAGFDNVVASLGTAFTPAQARLLARYTERIVVSYDGDAAGAAATKRSLDMLLEKGFDVRVVSLPDGMDPDDFIRAEGTEAYGQQLKQAPEYLEFLVHQEIRSRDLSRVEEKVAAVNAVLPHLAKLTSTIERASWATRLADLLRIDEDLVVQELRGVLKSAGTRVRHRAVERSPGDAEIWLVTQLLRTEEERERWCEKLDWEDLRGTTVLGIVQAIFDLAAKGERVDYPAVLAALTADADRELLTRIAFREDPEEGPSVEDCMCTFKRERLAREGRRLARTLGESQRGNERDSTDTHDEDVDRQLARAYELARQRDALMN